MSRSLLLWVTISVALSITGCDCKQPPINKIDQCKGVPGQQVDKNDPCTADNQCGDHFACRATKDQPELMCCVFNDRACNTEADCCPGQTCPAERKKCFDRFIACQTDADCGDKGDRVCESYSDVYGESTRCRFRQCGPLGECADGTSCFNGECLADLPCGGRCDQGKGCVATIDRCQDYASPAGREAAACPMTCQAGFIATFKDARNIWDACTLNDVACICAELPGLRSNDLGRFSSIGANPGDSLFVSAYDGQYGDLVVVKYGLDGKKQATEYVDGVPSAAVKYGPSGARGGVVEPGDDVGRYTDLVVNGGKVFVSYYDVTNGDLKVAVRASNGSWTKHKVDGSSGDVGLYSSIAVDSDGVPGVAYFQRAGDASFNIMDCPTPRPTAPLKYVTALKYAKASSANPTAATDWTVKTVACAARPPPPCDACNGICADTGNGDGAQCYTAASGCTTTCASGSSCVDVNGTPTCGETVTPARLQEVTPGIGLFPSIAFKGKDAFVAYQRRTKTGTTPADGDLYAVVISAANTVQTPVLIDGSGDTGWFPDLKIEGQSGTIAIGYHDFSSKSFKFVSSTQLQAGITPEVIDRGVDATMPGNQSWVGTDSAIVFGGSGVVYALYQDATKGDLKMARRTSTWAVVPSPRTEGAVGFFADAVVTDGKVYASHARIHAKLVGGEPQLDNGLLLETITP